MDRKLYRQHLDALRHAPPAVRMASHAMPDDDDFAAFSAHDYGRRRRLHPDVAWEDACRAYALAAASYADHDGKLDLDMELKLEDQWEHLRGDGGPDWPVVRTLLREAWRWLDAREDAIAAQPPRAH